MSFTQGVSGLNAASTNLDTIGNNIANSQTVGFKSGRSEFADLYAGAKTGLGVTVANTSQNFSGGSLNTTGRDLDLAIDGGGFFRLANGNQTEYSRDGQFTQTKDGTIANSSGALLTGYNVSNFNSPTTPASISASGNPVPIQIPSQPLSARATTQASLQAALDAGSQVNNAAFNANDPSTYDYSAPSTVYDSLGNAHSINQYFTKTGQNQWQVNAQVSLASGSAPLNPVTLQFDSSGNLSSVSGGSGTGTSSNAVTYQLNLGNGAATPQNFNFDFAGSTQTAQKFAAGNPTQDGYAAGALTGVAIQKDGTVTGSYANGQKVDLAQVALAGFRNEQGLAPTSGNAWTETAESGQPAVGTAGTGQLGNLRGGTLEQSNVDLSKQLVNMIVAQRNYQANAQTIKTQSQVLQTAVNLG